MNDKLINRIIKVTILFSIPVLGYIIGSAL